MPKMVIMDINYKIKSLPIGKQKIIGLSLVFSILILMPALIWGVITQTFNLNKQAGNTTDICMPVGKTITVSPITDPTGLCHDIQHAVDAVTGDGYTIQINPGNYNVISSINVAGKSNLKITGNENSDISQTWINFNSDSWGFKISSSSGSINWLSAEGITPNGLLSIQTSDNYTIGNTILAGYGSHTLDAQNSNNITINTSVVQSSAGALEFYNINGLNIVNNKIRHSANGISINNSQQINIVSNLISDNSESGIITRNISDLLVSKNSIVNTAYTGEVYPSIRMTGAVLGSIQFIDNIIAYGQGAGFVLETPGAPITFQRNDIWNVSSSYLGVSSQTGINGNISAEPLINTTPGYNYCLLDGSPVIYGSVTNGEYMGYIGLCSSYPTPLPKPGYCSDPFLINITPKSQSGYPGQTVTYNITITNNHDSTCGSYTSHLIIDNPSNWLTQFGTDTFTMSPNHSFSTYLNVTPSTENYILGDNPLAFRVLTEEMSYMGNDILTYTLLAPTPSPVPTPTPTMSPTPLPSPTTSPTPTPTIRPTATPSPSATPKPGDVNGDGVVNIIDIGIIIDNYRVSPIRDPRADLNHDGIVNIVDIGIVIDNYLF